MRKILELALRCLVTVPPACVAAAHAATESVVYAFKGGSDGAMPVGALINVHGTLYGTTFSGGGCTSISTGGGTIFKITPNGKESVVYAFGNAPDGIGPSSELLDVGGVLYGTTRYGGVGSGSNICPGSGPGFSPIGCGTIFRATMDGKESVLYFFRGGNDRFDPAGGLTNLDGVLYGTTADGEISTEARGICGCGTAFSTTLAGVHTVIHRFKAGGDGGYPFSTLVNVGGTLYGTTLHAAFALKPDGRETVLHKFIGGKEDGDYPGSVANSGGKLYGTTARGGANNWGVVYGLTIVGTETVYQSFARGKSGWLSKAAPLKVGGKLYGTSPYGGGGNHNNGGVVFGVKPAVGATIEPLHVFVTKDQTTDGEIPRAGLLKVGGIYYGTTAAGGSSNLGTVYKFVP